MCAAALQSAKCVLRSSLLAVFVVPIQRQIPRRERSPGKPPGRGFCLLCSALPNRLPVEPLGGTGQRHVDNKKHAKMSLDDLPQRRGTMKGSIHRHTSGRGYGIYREGPPSERFPTWRSETDEAFERKVVLGRSKSWQHAHPERRARCAEEQLVSGEVGDFTRPGFDPSKPPRYAFIDPSYRNPMKTNRRGVHPDPKGGRVLYPKDPSYFKEEPTRLNSPVSDLPRARSRALSLSEGRLDASFNKSAHNDLAMTAQPEAFQATLPFERSRADAVYRGNKTRAGNMRHWSGGLRGMRY